jgi:hypothetical protein
VNFATVTFGMAVYHAAHKTFAAEADWKPTCNLRLVSRAGVKVELVVFD